MSAPPRRRRDLVRDWPEALLTGIVILYVALYALVSALIVMPVMIILPAKPRGWVGRIMADQIGRPARWVGL